MTSNNIRCVALVIACMSAIACASEESDVDTTPSNGQEAEHPEAMAGSQAGLHVIVEEQLPKGGFVRFSATKGGGILIEEAGPAEKHRDTSADENRMDEVQLYEHIAGKAAPEALRRATEYLRLLKQNPPGPYQDDPEEPPTVSSAAHEVKTDKHGSFAESRQWFRDTYCRKTDRYVEYLNYAGWYKWSAKGVNYFKGGTYAASGQIWSRYFEMERGIDGCVGCNVEGYLPAGWYYGRRFSVGGNYEQSVISEIDQASDPGDAWDLCINWHY